MTIEPPVDVWHDRDLPFLLVAAPRVDAAPFIGIQLREVAETLGWGPQKTLAAAKSLADAGFIELKMMMGNDGMSSRVSSVSAAARVETGMWPSDEIAADRLLAAINAVAERHDLDPEQLSRWQKIRDSLSGVGRQVLVQVAASTLSGEIPHPH